MQKLLFIFLAAILPAALVAQPYQQWAVHYNGPAGSQDFGRSFVVDDQSNTYIIGSSDSAGTGKDIAVIKYDSLGNQIWASRYNGPDNLADWGYAIVMDETGNIYITGETATLATAADLITIKYSSAGILQWAKTYNGTASGNDAAVDIALDNSGNIFVTGKSAGTGSSDDYLTIKYNNAGDEIWVQRYNGTGNSIDEARTMHTDALGNIYVSGGSIGDTTDYDFVTIKYNSLGTPQWTARYNGLGNAYDLVFYQGSLITDSLGNVYICGYSTGADSLYEYTVVKYDSLGNQIWDARQGGHRLGKDDFSNAISLDNSLSVYITGAMYDSTADYNITTIKYDSAGVLQWQAAYDGFDNDWDEGYGIIVDDTGNVYVGGRSNKAGFTGADFVIIKYNSTGSEQWNVRYSRGGFSWPYKLRMDNQNNLYIGGWSSASSPAAADFTVVKYGPTPVGITEQKKNEETLNIYPNPCNGRFYLQGKYKLPAVIQLYDATGKRVNQQGITAATQSISFGNLPKGNYFLQLTSSKSTINRKIIIQ